MTLETKSSQNTSEIEGKGQYTKACFMDCNTLTLFNKGAHIRQSFIFCIFSCHFNNKDLIYSRQIQSYLVC